MHVHVEKGEAEAKFWLGQSVALADSYGFNRSELAELTRVIEARRNEIERAWNEHFG